MRLWTFAACAAMLLAFAGEAALSQTYPIVFVDDNFDSYTNQTEFNAAWAPVGTTTDATKQAAQLDTTQFVSSPNSAFIPQSTTATATSTEFVSRRTFAETEGLFEGEKLIFSFDFREQGFFNNPQRNYARLQDGTAPVATNQLVAMGTNNNLFAAQDGGNYYMARILGYTPSFQESTNPAQPNPAATSGAFFKLNDPGAPLRTGNNVWVNLKVEMSSDGDGKTDYRFYVNNILSKTVLDVGTIVRSYDNITIGSGLTNGGNQAYFDNMKLEVVMATEPEFHAGDHNQDGVVDIKDYITWRSDPAGNGSDQGFADWQADFGKPPLGGGSAASAAVPEPTSVALLALGLAVAGCYRRGR